jgi:hypothetical protein
MTDLLQRALDGLGNPRHPPALTRQTPYLDVDAPYAVATCRRLASTPPGAALTSADRG